MEIPNEFICPITLEIMSDPVICSDGNSYERKAILQIRDSLSPLTREPIDKNNLIPNRALKNIILHYNTKINSLQMELEKIITIKNELELELESYRQPKQEIIQLKAPTVKHMLYINSSIDQLYYLLDNKIYESKNTIKTLLFNFYDKIHLVDNDIVKIFNISLKKNIKSLNIDNLMEVFSMINIDGTFLLMFEHNIKLVLHEFIKLIKYIFLL